MARRKARLIQAQRRLGIAGLAARAEEIAERVLRDAQIAQRFPRLRIVAGELFGSRKARLIQAQRRLGIAGLVALQGELAKVQLDRREQPCRFGRARLIRHESLCNAKGRFDQVEGPGQVAHGAFRLRENAEGFGGVERGLPVGQMAGQIGQVGQCGKDGRVVPPGLFKRRRRVIQEIIHPLPQGCAPLAGQARRQMRRDVPVQAACGQARRGRVGADQQAAAVEGGQKIMPGAVLGQFGVVDDRDLPQPVLHHAFGREHRRAFQHPFRRLGDGRMVADRFGQAFQRVFDNPGQAAATPAGAQLRGLAVGGAVEREDARFPQVLQHLLHRHAGGEAGVGGPPGAIAQADPRRQYVDQQRHAAGQLQHGPGHNLVRPGQARPVDRAEIFAQQRHTVGEGQIVDGNRRQPALRAQRRQVHPRRRHKDDLVGHTVHIADVDLVQEPGFADIVEHDQRPRTDPVRKRGLAVGSPCRLQRLCRRGAFADKVANMGRDRIFALQLFFLLGQLVTRLSRQIGKGIGQRTPALAIQEPAAARGVNGGKGMGILHRKRRLALAAQPVDRRDDAEFVAHDGVMERGDLAFPPDELVIAGPEVLLTVSEGREVDLIKPFVDLAVQGADRPDQPVAMPGLYRVKTVGNIALQQFEDQITRITDRPDVDRFVILQASQPRDRGGDVRVRRQRRLRVLQRGDGGDIDLLDPVAAAGIGMHEAQIFLKLADAIFAFQVVGRDEGQKHDGIAHAFGQPVFPAVIGFQCALVEKDPERRRRDRTIILDQAEAEGVDPADLRVIFDFPIVAVVRARVGNEQIPFLVCGHNELSF